MPCIQSSPWPAWTIYVASTWPRPPSPGSRYGVDCQGAEADVRIANSELEWSAVAKYNAEELADDSKDERGWRKQSSLWKWKPWKGRKSTSSQLRSNGAHTLCTIQLLDAQLHWACRRVTRSWGNQEWFVVVLTVMQRIVVLFFVMLALYFFVVLLFATANTKIFVVAIFSGLNFHGNKFLLLRVAHHHYCHYFFVSTNFRGVNFAGAACPQKLVPRWKYLRLRYNCYLYY